ncbi:Fructose dehydrogenase cytochrome subunit [Paraburkholderia aspalathi]|uniref:cytochrome c n=1 Tax=Paraburkholderia aspalathi TaxID=1324617 RepID=UPI001B09CE24|nr:cytochrome c [Paraburkholderia aspalathi]CAE6745763.1 Fructose dehydrogenase cytochrome subunit [Paraburkholderia aspalathi]CAE6759343.1 Fructose dehydrogenase cytochrome subunit [Paraburkholderia aspalathi]
MNQRFFSICHSFDSAAKNSRALIACAALGLAGTVGTHATTAMAQQVANSVTPAPAPKSEAALIKQGRLLAIASDCMACHTVTDKGREFAGGYGIVSPMGTIYSTNITPSRRAGIGNYTEAQFARALREGVRADGAHLYPAMPYTAYTGMTDRDVHALYTYFMKGVEPVDEVPPQTALPFPFSIRQSMIVWNLLFLKDRRFAVDPQKSEEWNRGAYLTNVLAHCSACHTPRNMLMAEDLDRGFSGAQLGPWYAPNITSDPVSGIGAWSDAEIVDYLKTGHVIGKNQAAGGMAEAVQNSLQFLSADDLHSIAVYLKSTAPIRTSGESRPAFGIAGRGGDEALLRGTSSQNNVEAPRSGAALFSGYCASCHRPDGAGSTDQSYPSLFHNTATGGLNPSNLIAAILHGVDRKVGDQHVLMPNFGDDSFVQPLTDEQIAAISNYVLQRFGNSNLTVSANDVAVARKGGQLPFLAWVQPFLPVAGIAVLVILAIGFLWGKRRSRRLTAQSSR